MTLHNQPAIYVSQQAAQQAARFINGPQIKGHMFPPSGSIVLMLQDGDTLAVTHGMIDMIFNNHPKFMGFRA